jgi:hypothetical protein
MQFGRPEVTMPEEFLHDPDIDALIEECHGEGLYWRYENWTYP